MPTLAISTLPLPVLTVKERVTSWRLPALNRRPPEWRMLPTAVDGSRLPPVIGKLIAPPWTCAGAIGVTLTLFFFRTLATPLSRVREVEPLAIGLADAPGAKKRATASAARDDKTGPRQARNSSVLREYCC